MYKLYGRPGSGSGAVEAVLRLAEIDCEIVDLSRWAEGEPPAELLAVNPLGQVTLILPDGGIMTELAAICVHLADLHPSCGLSPSVSEPSRAAFLRWMFYLAANVYMSELRCYYPYRYTLDPGAADGIREFGAGAQDVRVVRLRRRSRRQALRARRQAVGGRYLRGHADQLGR